MFISSFRTKHKHSASSLTQQNTAIKTQTYANRFIGMMHLCALYQLTNRLGVNDVHILVYLMGWFSLLARVTHICVRSLLVQMMNYYLNQSRLVNKLHRIWNQNTIFNQGNDFDNIVYKLAVILPHPQCGIKVVTAKFIAACRTLHARFGKTTCHQLHLWL